MSLKDTFVKFGLVTDDQPQKTATSPPSAATIAPISVFRTTQAPVPPVFRNTSMADAETVNKLKGLVLDSSPIIKQFMKNVELVRAQFPNDENACMKAALAFTQVAKTNLIAELNQAVAASLLHVKKTTETDRQSARATSVGDLDKQSNSLTGDIKDMEGRIVELQQSIADKRASLGTVTQKIQAIELDLQKQDAIIAASFTEVENFVATLGKVFATL